MIKGNRKIFLNLLIVMGFILLVAWSGMASAAQWAETYGGTGYDEAKSIQKTTDGGYIVAGRTKGYNGYYDFWVSKLDGSSNVVWQKTYGGPYDDWANSIQQTTDGGYIVAGYTKQHTPLTSDFWIMKLDGSGNIVWSKIYGGSSLAYYDYNSNDEARSIQQTADGGYIVAGMTNASGAGNTDAWVLKLDGSGKAVWQKTYGGTSYDEARFIQQTADGGYIVAGYTNSFGAGGYDFWVLKFDGYGNITWQKTYGGAAFDVANSIQQTADGGYIVAGYYTNSSGAGNADAWVLKLDGSGNVVWQKTYGGTNFDAARSIQQTTDGGYIVAGYTNSFGAGGYDFWVLKFDGTGSVVWQKTYGGTSNDEANSIQQTTDGGYIVAGYTKSFGAGNPDAWVLKLDSSGQLYRCAATGTSSAAVAVTGVMGRNSAARIGYSNPQIYNSPVAGVSSLLTKTEVCSDNPFQIYYRVRY